MVDVFRLDVMKSIYGIALGLSVLGLSAFGISTASSSKSQRKSHSVVGKSPVLVELFTSEGCSSCPPADELLRNIQTEQPNENALIIPLSEHVDYWNSATWTDRFSTPQFSQRQMQYVQALHLREPYTPQMVVDGQSEFVGSDSDTASDAIAHAARKKKAQVDIQLTDSKSTESGNHAATLIVHVGSLAGLQAEGANDVFVAVTENGLSSTVRGGENMGRTLSHTAVVRLLEKVGTIDTADSFETQVKLKLDARWKVRDLSFVAFVQAHRSRRILGAGISNPTAL